MKPSGVTQNEGFQFIVTTPSQRRSQAQQRLVRSHVSRGRPRRKGGRPLPSWIDKGGDVSSESVQQRKFDNIVIPRPTRVGSEFSWVRFPENMKPYMYQDIIRFLTVVRDGLYPSQICLQTDSEENDWVGLLLSDPVYLHSMIFSSEAFLDESLGREHSMLTQLHFIKTLKLLQERIAVPDDPLAIADQTIMAVVTLALAAQAFGDRVTMENHMQGLQQMVNLRGGFGSLQSRTHELPAKICRADLGFALRFGHKPIFFYDSVSWDRYVTDPISTHPSGPGPQDEIPEFIQSLDGRLANVWKDLQRFSSICNLAGQTGHRFTHTTFSEIMVSVLYRLLHISVPDDCPVNEAIRMGMIAFAAAIFLQWQYFKEGLERVGEMFSCALLRLRNLSIDVPPQVLFWLLMVLNVTFVEDVIKPHETWFDRVVEFVGVSSWDEARRVLKSMIWIDAINGLRGKAALEDALSRVND